MSYVQRDIDSMMREQYGAEWDEALKRGDERRRKERRALVIGLLLVVPAAAVIVAIGVALAELAHHNWQSTTARAVEYRASPRSR